MRYFAIAFALLCALSIITTHAQQSDYDSLKTEAEKFYSEGSYGKAREIFAKAREFARLPADSRWIDFRLAPLCQVDRPAGLVQLGHGGAAGDALPPLRDR